MSKYNKVNPGIYTQRGRLTPDEAARERRKQREISPARTSQPMSSETRPAPPPPGGANRAAAPSVPKREAAPARTAKTATGSTKAGTAKPAAKKRTGTRPARKAVLARNAGGPGAAPRSAAKRRNR